ncbi:class III extradiol ring-cleavage dioxygenase [Pseudomaricurvus sp. HS19]|uniref:DODA-type extradiol aromatic ring-opening family dioxygenase n=1 Tax=Pseudomaricurvus sp. HS19 TaxID=2692626 RepID=UPI001368322F|nr:class III extradiol ring-cleavage dioxygenase [Pseudomaricurvus sp. HS19]MYM63919.1 dioxygenase [Pseudomaricurvus sp. HS19]
MSSPTILFLSHGGGPMPLLGDPSHAEMVTCLQAIAADIPKPSAIVVISAHWETRAPCVTSGATPELIYDYYNFPEESYSIQYPCPGEPALATAVQQALTEQGIPCDADARRGFDHGLFVPLKIMYPQANIPCVQLSLSNSLDPELHLGIGEALQTLAQENVLVIGSGFSFHNMKAFFAGNDPDVVARNQAFEDWLHSTCTDTTLDEGERRQRLHDWEDAPQARFCHPREEHLLPLHICYGLAARAADSSYRLTILNRQSSMYLWRS